MLGYIFLLAVVLYLFYYLVKSVYKLNIFNKINNRFYRALVSIIVLSLIFIFFNLVNSFVIYFHLIIFLLIFNIIFYFVNKKRSKKKQISHDCILYIALCTTIVYFIIGAYLNYHVWETKYEVYTSKDIGGEYFRVVQISDSHMGNSFSGKDFIKYIDRINKTNPDIVVITGDFIDDDTSKQDMIDACNALGKLSSTYGTYLVYGNHDLGYYSNKDYSSNDLVENLTKNNVTILEDEVELINDNIYLVGRKDKRYSRMSIDELVKDLDKNKYIIDLNHQPNDYDNESKAKVDLVLSGHSHGGQFIPLGPIGKIIKANDEYKGLHKRDKTTFIVNTGISGWAIKFKTGTKSEYVVVDIINK